jgi:hypothetical protein
MSCPVVCHGNFEDTTLRTGHEELQQYQQCLWCSYVPHKIRDILSHLSWTPFSRREDIKIVPGINRSSSQTLDKARCQPSHTDLLRVAQANVSQHADLYHCIHSTLPSWSAVVLAMPSLLLAKGLRMTHKVPIPAY